MTVSWHDSSVVKGLVVALLLGAALSSSGVAGAARAPIQVREGRTFVRASAPGSPDFAVGRSVQCRTFGRLLTVHVPRLGETTRQFRTKAGKKVWLYLIHDSLSTTVWCGAAEWFGGH